MAPSPVNSPGPIVVQRFTRNDSVSLQAAWTAARCGGWLGAEAIPPATLS